MNKLRPLLGVALLASAALTSAADRPGIDVTELELENGMKWLLFAQHESPSIAAGWVAHVGSANERPGITGISHLFEHMLFKGTHTIGTTDIERDLELIEEQERVRSGMRAEMKKMREALRRGEIDDIAAAESRTERYNELEKEFDALVEEQRKVIVKDEMDQIYTSNGGENLNAGTTEDLTLYFIQVPSNRLELWAWLESDRLLNPVLREFYSERDVVFEERRLRTESTPLGKFDEAFNALFWEAHPYSWPVVGWPSDIPAITKEQADEYLATYYAPNNLTGVLVGDFDTAEARALIERYFGRIPRGKIEPPEVLTLEPAQKGEKRYNAEAETSPTVRVWWHAVPFVHKEQPALDLLTDVLSGRTGRLYKGLVEGREIANDCSASVDPKKYAGQVGIECTVKDGQDPAVVEAAIYEELERIVEEGVTGREIQKVKNQAKANAYRRLSSPFFIALQLLFYDGLGNWNYINEYSDGIDAVTAADLRRVTQTYFTKDNRTVGTFLRKEGAAPEDPEIAALPAQAQAMVKQSLARLEAQTDPAQLQQALAQMESGMSQAPDEMRPAIELILKRTRERLEQLQGEGK